MPPGPGLAYKHHSAILASTMPGLRAKCRRMANPDDLKQLAPTGQLRGGVVVSPAASAFFAIRDGNGEVQGVTVDLVRAFAESLKLPLALQVFENSGQVTDAVAKGDCDLAFMPQDAERAKKGRFRPGLLFHLQHLSGAGRLDHPKHRGGQPARRAHRRHLQHHDRAQRAAHRAQCFRRGSAERRSDDRDGANGAGRRLRAVARLVRRPAAETAGRARAARAFPADRHRGGGAEGPRRPR